MKRIQSDYIQKDLSSGKMVFLSGPRQVGKIYLAKQLASLYLKPLYLNYDNVLDRAIIQSQS